MRLLIVGSLNGYMGAASRIALNKGARVLHAETIERGLTTLRGGQGADLAFVDVALDVAAFITSLQSERINGPVVACGIGADTAAAVRAIKAGAKEYLPLPPDPELIAAVLAAVGEESHAIIHGDPVMQRTLRLADQVAPSEATIMINGESGTGKELMARYIHRRSRRADKPFVSVNCAAIPENLLESELFGHEKGAFTGAVARRVGKFEEAHGGTLLLDEISEMHPRLQAKLLRAVQEREIDRVGGGQPVKVDIRLICTTNRHLEEEVRAGNFREDLFFRINVMNLRLPSLRERPGDIPKLALHFVEKYSAANGVAVRPLSAEARTTLLRHSWPGNVRELENTMHRAVLLAQGTEIGPEAIFLTSTILSDRTAAPVQSGPAGATGGATGAGAPPAVGSAELPAALIGRTVDSVERDLIIGTLSHCLGNRTHAATILGISIRTLRNKLRQYSDEGVPVPPPQSPSYA
ncbi:MAG: sigma-54-dependent transcriptional regulator [Alphaproteobacteria bacterium]